MRSLKKGIGFGLTSGVITTLGLIVGLHTGFQSKAIVIGGILTIAIADAMSDALGMHLSEEFDRREHKEVWETTFHTFVFKFIIALSFLVPISLFPHPLGMYASIIWGMLLLSVLSYFIGREREENPWKIISEHVIIALAVVVASHIVGDFISSIFK